MKLLPRILYLSLKESIFVWFRQTLWQTVWAEQWQHRKNTSLLVVFPAPPLLISLSGISGCFLRGWFVRGRNLENQQRAAAAWQPLDPAHCALMHPMNIRTILEEVAFRKQSNVELFLVCGGCFLLVSALHLEATTHCILMHPIDLVTMQRRKRGFLFCVGEFFKWFVKKGSPTSKRCFFCRDSSWQGGFSPWMGSSFQVEWANKRAVGISDGLVFGWTRSGQFRKLISSGERKEK